MIILVPKSEDLSRQLYGIIQQRLAHYQAIQDSPWEGKSARLESENIVELFHAGLDAIATQADTNVLYAGIFEMGDGTGDVRTSISDGNTQDDVFLLRHQGNSGYPPTPKFVIFNTLPNFSQGAVGFSRFIGYKFVIE